MQALWSRANRPITSSCRCKWCLSTPSAAFRKSIIGGGNGRFQLKHLTTTLFYSSLITTAAAVDVKVKRKRREHLDRAIAEVESSLGNPSICSQHVEEEELTWTSAGAEEIDFGSLSEEGLRSSIAQNRSSYGKREHLQSKGELNLLRYLNDGYHDTGLVNELINEVLSGLSRTQGSEPDPIVLINPGPQSIYASERLRNKQSEESFVPKKILRLELTTAQLAMRLLLRTTPSHQGSVGPRSRSSLTKTLREITAKLLELNHREAFDVGDIGRLQYPQYNDTTPAFIKENTTSFNSSLDDLTKDLVHIGRRRRRDIVAKIAYNLLISPVPPNTATYAMLLSRLSEADEARLADDVAVAFFVSRRRANETMVHSILEHCRRHHRDRQFNILVQKLQGHHGGLNLGWGSSETAASYLRKAGGKMYQTILPDRAIFHSMIAGYLEQDQLEQGLNAFRWMRAESVQPDLTTYNIFLQHFSQNGHWERGFGIWEKAKVLLAQQDQVDLSRPGPANRAYGLALKLCERCMKHDKRKTILNEAQSKGFERLHEHDGPNEAPSWSKSTPFQKSMRILERRVEFVRRDIERLWIQVRSSKIILSGRPLNEIRKVFLRHANEPTYQEWLERSVSDDKRKRMHGRSSVNTFVEAGSSPSGDWLPSPSTSMQTDSLSARTDVPVLDKRMERDRHEAESPSGLSPPIVRSSGQPTNAASDIDALEGNARQVLDHTPRGPKGMSEFVRAWRLTDADASDERMAGVG